MIDGCKMYVFKVFADISRTCDNTVVLGNQPKFALSKEVSGALFRNLFSPNLSTSCRNRSSHPTETHRAAEAGRRFSLFAS